MWIHPDCMPLELSLCRAFVVCKYWFYNRRKRTIFIEDVKLQILSVQSCYLFNLE